MTRQVNQSVAVSMRAARVAGMLFFLVLTACVSEATVPTADPPGALVRLQRGAQRHSIRFDPRTPDLPPALQRLVREIMRLRSRF